MTPSLHSSCWPWVCLFGRTPGLSGMAQGEVFLPRSQVAQCVAEIPMQADQTVLLI